jgi:hypothetical protein
MRMCVCVTTFADAQVMLLISILCTSQFRLDKPRDDGNVLGCSLLYHYPSYVTPSLLFRFEAYCICPQRPLPYRPGEHRLRPCISVGRTTPTCPLSFGFSSIRHHLVTIRLQLLQVCSRMACPLTTYPPCQKKKLTDSFDPVRLKQDASRAAACKKAATEAETTLAGPLILAAHLGFLPTSTHIGGQPNDSAQPFAISLA